MPHPPENLSAWRKTQRDSLIEQRMKVDPATLSRWRVAMDRHIEHGFPGLAAKCVAICWPYRNEYDARHVAAHFRRTGARICLPVVIAARQPLIFRPWRPGTPMARGALGIPYPARGEPVQPEAVLLPMVGFDLQGYRLGYGGGFFDRTLAALSAAQALPVVIGVAHELARMDSIFPQPHDLPMDYVVTEAGIYRRDVDASQSRLVFLGAPSGGGTSELSSPVCYANEVAPDYFGKH